MQAADQGSQPSCAPSALRPSSFIITARGFSFTEVLFAVMILGVGFIMVAAIFPVAIQQAKTSTEETSAAAIARGAINYIDRVATNSILPGTNNMVVGPDFDGFPPTSGMPDYRDTYTLATALRGSVVVAGDSRYAWLPFYRRAGERFNDKTWSPFAQVIMVPVLMRAESDFSGLTGPPNNPLSKGGPLVQQHTTTGIPGTARLTATFTDGVAATPTRSPSTARSPPTSTSPPKART